ncbi:MAG: thiamine pyrophosphate-binding protein [Halobacteriales archaeon]
MRASEAVVETLGRHGVDTVFGIPGTQSLPLNEAIADRSDIRYVMARHETAVSHQAWGYAEICGRPAATVVVPGPGDMNAMNGLKNALNDCVPIIHIAVETDPTLRGTDAIHETPPETYDTVVKENITVSTAEGIAAALERAIAAALTPPKGPVRIGIPRSFLMQAAPQATAGPYTRAGIGESPPASVAAAVDHLVGADRPLIVAGGGIRAAGAEATLQNVAERLDAPVVTTYKGKGVFPEEHALYAGLLSVGSSDNLRSFTAAADVALAVGTDLDAVTTQQFDIELPETLVHVTLHEADIGRGYDPAVGIVADARTTLTAIIEAIEDRDDIATASNGADRAQTVRTADAELIADAVAVDEPPLTSASAEAVIDRVLPDDAVFSLDAGGFRIWALYVIEATADRSVIDTGSWATMGTSLPAAVGAKLAAPDRPVVALVGDGGLLMCMQELHTVAAESIPVITIVFNNSDYATISDRAAADFDLPTGAFGWSDEPIGFVGIAEQLGVTAAHADTPARIEAELNAALDRETPTLIEVPTDPTEPQAKPID